MESEKVKEIKKALEHCAIHECSDSCIFSKKHPFACLTEMHKQLLTLINELESENERLKQSKNNILFVNEQVIEKNKKLKNQIDEMVEKSIKEFAEELEQVIVNNSYPYFDKDGKPVTIWKATTGFDAIEETLKSYRKKER